MDTQPATCRCGTGPKSGLKLTGVKARSFATNPEMLSTIRGQPVGPISRRSAD